MFLLPFLAVAGPADAQASLANWVRQHAAPIRTVESVSRNDDLRPFRRIIGDARVIAFTEQTHNEHEWLALRSRVFQYLVEREGITAYAAETDLLAGMAIDDYVMGKGDLTSELVQGVFSWSPQPHDENRLLIEWIRAYNARPTTRQKVRFYGLDVGGQPIACKKVYIEEFKEETCLKEPSGYILNYDYALTYLEDCGLEDLRSRARALRAILRHFDISGYASVPEEEWHRLSAALTEMIGVLDSERVRLSDKTSSLAHGRAYRAAATARYMEPYAQHWLRTHRPIVDKTTWGTSVPMREEAMVDNLRWVVERENVRRGRVFVFMQAGHLSLSEASAGGRARRIFGPDFVSIGSLSFASDEPEIHDGEWKRANREQAARGAGTLAGLLDSVPLPIYVLDYRGMPAEAASVRPLFMGDSSCPSWLVPADSQWPASHPANQFDAIVVIKKVTSAHPLGFTH